jgi:hypothetical protein
MTNFKNGKSTKKHQKAPKSTKIAPKSTKIAPKNTGKDIKIKSSFYDGITS